MPKIKMNRGADFPLKAADLKHNRAYERRDDGNIIMIDEKYATIIGNDKHAIVEKCYITSGVYREVTLSIELEVI